MWKRQWDFMRKLGQVTLETVCYLESVFIATLLEGMMTTAANDRAYRDLPTQQNRATTLHLCEMGRGVGLNCNMQPGRLHSSKIFHTPVQMCDFYIICKY